jgi:hypothetical protein
MGKFLSKYIMTGKEEQEQYVYFHKKSKRLGDVSGYRLQVSVHRLSVFIADG